MPLTALDQDSGLAVLNTFLADHSYIDGFQPSQADTVVFEAVKEGDIKKYEHIARWHSHIKSFGDSKRASFPGTKKALSEYGPATVAAPASDDVDLFGSDSEEDAEAEAEKARRLAEYHAKKATKPAVIAKSSVVLDVKPWDSETDMKELESLVRAISLDGLLWGASELKPIGYGIMKLQISCVVEDEKVGVDLLEEKITELENHVQSMDVVSFNKI